MTSSREKRKTMECPRNKVGANKRNMCVFDNLPVWETTKYVKIIFTETLEFHRARINTALRGSNKHQKWYLFRRCRKSVPKTTSGPAPAPDQHQHRTSTGTGTKT